MEVIKCKYLSETYSKNNELLINHIVYNSSDDVHIGGGMIVLVYMMGPMETAVSLGN